ncbi:MAG: Xaa-Pro peptidase family protein [Thermoleophilia bacterium]
MVIDGERLCAGAQELRARRARLASSIDDGQIILVASAPFPRRSVRFRQTNEFYYLTGLEVPGAYVLIDGQEGSTTVYLPHRDEQRERTDGPALWAEDVDRVRGVSGVDAVKSVEAMPLEIARRLFRGALIVHTPFAPSEGERQSRDGLLGGTAARLSDPLRAHPPAAGSLGPALAEHFPLAECRDLTPVLDEMRLIKSQSELSLMREAARLTGIAVTEAMRSTEPGVREYELGAVADFVFLQGGAAGGSYEAIVASGANAWHGHYVQKTSTLAAGELVLMDYAPDFNYYTSDIGRMWPVSGRWEDWQLELYGFILRYHYALLSRISPGGTVAQVLDAAAAEMRDVVEETAWSAPEFEAAARAALVFRGHLSHPVGMTVHDVGRYQQRPFQEGLVFSVDPMLWVPERSLYIRCEDTVAVVPGGIENLTGSVALEPSAIESTMAEPGLLQYWRDR